MPLDFLRRRAGELMPNGVAGDFTAQFVQSQGNQQPLLAGHLPVTADLFI